MGSHASESRSPTPFAAAGVGNLRLDLVWIPLRSLCGSLMWRTPCGDNMAIFTRSAVGRLARRALVIECMGQQRSGFDFLPLGILCRGKEHCLLSTQVRSRASPALADPTTHEYSTQRFHPVQGERIAEAKTLLCGQAISGRHHNGGKRVSKSFVGQAVTEAKFVARNASVATHPRLLREPHPRRNHTLHQTHTRRMVGAKTIHLLREHGISLMM